jgi:RNA polymerase sigma-70 factor (ECF subfamily)
LDSGDNLDLALAAAQANAEWGWNGLYRNLAPSVTGYLRAQGAAEPEDLTADVFLQAVKAVKRFEGNGAAFRSWIFCIAHNKLVDESRYRRRRPVEPVAEPADDTPVPVAVEDEVLSHLAEDRVRLLLERLTSDQRDVLLLRILGGLTVDEVARTLGKNPPAVKALQRRGLACLKREIAAQTVSV